MVYYLFMTKTKDNKHKIQPFSLSLYPSERILIIEWIKKQDSHYSQSKAIRELIRLGLSNDKS